MIRLRFTLAQLMAILLYLGLGFAALRNANEFWASATYTLAIIMITAPLVGALARKGRVPMTWVGFAIFGWSYLLIPQLPPWSSGVRGGGPIPRPVLLIVCGFSCIKPYINTPLFGMGSWIEYEQVSHSLGIILFGLVGAALGHLLAVKDERPNP
jgi:hypothetical protein